MAWVHAQYAAELPQEGKRGQKEKTEWWHDRGWRQVNTGGNMESVILKHKGEEPPDMWTCMPGGKTFQFDWKQEKANAWVLHDPKAAEMKELRQELAQVKAELKAIKATKKKTIKPMKAMKAMKTEKNKAQGKQV